MILSRKPVTIAEVKAYMKNLEEKPALEEYFKKFNKLSADDAVACAKDIRALNNPKINEDQVVKIVDFHPEDAEDVSKIFVDVSLTEEESTALLALVKKY